MEFVDECSSQKEVVFVFDDGIREMVDEERAIALLETLSLPSPPNRVNLSNKSYSDTAAVQIAKKLNEFKGSIKVADIHDMIAGRPEDEALRSFSTIADSLKGNALEELNISDNALGAKGIQACRDLMVLGSLKRVFILNNGISEAAAELTATVLLDEGVRPELTLFNFYNNMCGNGGAAAVARIVDANPTLTDVRYSATRSNSEGMALLATSLTSLRGLVRLDLADNTLGSDVGKVLAKAVGSNPALEYLNLRDCALEDGGVLAVLEALKPSTVISHLDLSANDLTEEFIDAEALPLFASIIGKASLTFLALDDNELGTEGAHAVAAMAPSASSLTKLSMCYCAVTAAGAVALAKSVCGMASMKELLLDGNEICRSGIEKVEAMLEAAGKTLGEMEDNDSDGEDDFDEEEDGEEGEDNAEEVDELAAALEKGL